MADDNTPFGSQSAGQNHSPAAVVSLTRTAAAEAAGRTGLPKESVGTLHSFAYRFLGCPPIATSKGLIDDWNAHNPDMVLSGGTVSPDDDNVKDRPESDASGDKMMELYSLRRAQCVPRENWGRALANFAEKWEDWKQEIDAMDFSDLIEQATLDRMPSPGRFLYADEAQDQSEHELRLLRVMAQTCEKMTLVGDPDQCLYTFRGAHPEMFIDPRIPDANKTVLGQSYRVPRAVHRVAIAIAQRIKNRPNVVYNPTDDDGQVDHVNLPKINSPDRITRLIDDEQAAGRSVMIIAACDYHLNRTIRCLRDNGIPFANPWRRRQGAWNPLHVAKGTTMAERLRSLLSVSEQFADPERGPMLWTYQQLADWVEPLSASAVLNHGAKAKMRNAASKEPEGMPTDDELNQWFAIDQTNGQRVMVDDALRLAPLAGTDDAEKRQIIKRLARFWAENNQTRTRRSAQLACDIVCSGRSITKEPSVYIGTAHSFKGAEADTVILFPDISPAAKRNWENDQRDDIYRKFYVAVTRARHRLIVCDSGSDCCVPAELFMP